MMLHAPVPLEELERRLTAFLEAHAACDYFTDLAVALRCREFNQHQIGRLREEIAKRRRQPWRGRLWLASSNPESGDVSD